MNNCGDEEEADLFTTKFNSIYPDHLIFKVKGVYYYPTSSDYSSNIYEKIKNMKRKVINVFVDNVDIELLQKIDDLIIVQDWNQYDITLYNYTNRKIKKVLEECKIE